MRTKRIITHALCGALLLVAGRVSGQATVPGNSGGPGDYSGWDSGTGLPLEVRHNGNYPIEWYTDSIGRMRLSPSVTGPMGPGDQFPGVNRDGYLLLTGVPAALTDPNCRAPFTRLHLVDQEIPTTPSNYAQQQGFRPWQRNGITLTGNNDQSYIGQKYNGTDVTDLVVQWSDNPDSSPYGTDRMKFVFTTLYNSGSTRGAATMDGLEAMRLYPATYEEVHVGIGDYSQPGMGDPTERLELLDRTIRLRRIIPDYNNDTLTRVVMVDSNGRLHWRRISTWPVTGGGGGSDCDWNIANATTSGSGVAHTLWTATGTDDLCPDADDFVGIGTSAPSAKLDVRYAPSSGGTVIGHRVEIAGGASLKNGGEFYAQGTGTEHYGLQSYALNGSSANKGVRGWGKLDDSGSHTETVGVEGIASVASGSSVTSAIGLKAGSASGGTTTNNYGVHAEIFNYASSVTNNYGGYFDAWTNSGSASNYGVYTKASGGAAAWALYVNGAQYSSTSTSFSTSDAALKTNIEEADVNAAAHLLEQVRLHTYEFNSEACPQLNLASGTQLGVLAQEYTEVFPQFVRAVRQPAELDQEGNEVYPAQEFQAVSYDGLIPYLVAAFQSQQTTISEQENRLAAMEQAYANCCASGMILQGSGSAHEQVTGTEEEALMGLGRALRIAPNPFADRTALYYNLERAGRAQLLVNSADGRDLRVLSEAQREAGEYQFEWDTTGLAPGMYYVTLLLDGEPVVKRAVKVQR